MKKASRPLLSRREFTQRAAMLSATATIVPAEVILPKSPVATSSQEPPSTSIGGQAEIDWRHQQILSLYGHRLDEAQKTNLKKMCADLQPSLERVRSFALENGDAPALYLKPLVEREKKTGNPSEPASGSKKS